jgi:hypothetical protein
MTEIVEDLGGLLPEVSGRSRVSGCPVGVT